MTNKEYLKQLWTLDGEIAVLSQEIEDLRIRAKCIGSPNTDCERVMTSPDQEARYTKYIAEMVDIMDMVRRQQEQYASLRKRITQSICQMDNADERIVLRRRYLLHQTWEQIAEEMNASRRTVIYWHGTALIHFKQ